MRTFRYNEPTGKIIERTEDEIFDEYWNVWREKVIKAGLSSPNFLDPLTRKYCLEDWCTENWAWEVTEPTKIINIWGCACSKDEWFECDQPCGYKAWEANRK
jgi:hypothetical protein